MAGTMTAQVRLSKPATLGARNATTGSTAVTPPQAYYEGPGRVQARGGSAPADSAAAREVNAAPYLVAVPVDLAAPVELGDLVDVLSSDDPVLVGARLYVTEVAAASILLQRNLGCDLHPPITPGG